MTISRFSIRLLALAAALLPIAGLSAAPTARPVSKTDAAVVRVNSTNQDYDFFRPWSKKNPRVFHGLGAVIAGNRVLVTAQLVANHNYVELERAESGQKTDARVAYVDYEANLALLEPNTREFLDGITPLELTQDAVVGDRVNVLQLESNDALISTPGPITTIEVARYQLEGTAFLVYRLSLSLQYKEGSFTAPVIKDGKLAGILMRYDPRAQSVDVLPAPVISHFLKDIDDGSYQGFPRAGMEYAPTRDPQLRHYAKLPAVGGGVYITDVPANGPAALAGVKPGDVLMEVEGHAIDQDGNYEEPLYGRISMTYLLSTLTYAGQTVTAKLMRDGRPLTVEMTMSHKPVQDYVSEPYVIDKAPKFCVVDGLIFEELSRQYLKEWGNDWQKQAPQRLVYLDRYQGALVPPGRKRIVILSQVLPAAGNIGYEDLKYLIVTNVNGKPINSLDDLPAALATPHDGFHKIEFEESPRELFLDAGALAEQNKNVQDSYGLPELQRLD